MRFTHQLVNWANKAQVVAALEKMGYYDIQESIHGSEKYITFMHKDNHTSNQILRLGAELGRIDNNVYCRL